MEPEPKLDMNELAEAMLVPDLPPEPPAAEPTVVEDPDLPQTRTVRKPPKHAQPGG